MVIFNKNRNQTGMKLMEWAVKKRERTTSFEKSLNVEKQGMGVVRRSNPAQIRCLRYKAYLSAGFVTLHGPQWLQHKLQARQAGSPGLHSLVSNSDPPSISAPPFSCLPVPSKAPTNHSTIIVTILLSLRSLSSLHAVIHGVIFGRNVFSLVTLQ